MEQELAYAQLKQLGKEQGWQVLFGARKYETWQVVQVLKLVQIWQLAEHAIHVLLLALR
jgi:hypothetical protein